MSVDADGRFCNADCGPRARDGSGSSLEFRSMLVSYTSCTLWQKRTDNIRRGSPAAQSQHTMQHDLSLAYLSGVLRSSIPNEFRRRTGSVFLLEVPRRSSTCLGTWFELDLLVCDRLGISVLLVVVALDGVMRSVSSATGSGLP